MLLVLEKTEAAADHDGDLAEMDIGEDALVRGLLSLLGCGDIVSAYGGDLDIDRERRCVGKITKTGVVGEHRENGAVVLEDGRLAELGIEEFNLDLVFVADSRALVGGGRCCGNGCGSVLGSLTHERICG